jgi:hypothetical protein
MTKDDRVETITDALRLAGWEVDSPAFTALGSLSTELQELREALESFDDEVQSTSSHYRIGWQDAVRAMRRAALSHQGKPNE